MLHVTISTGVTAPDHSPAKGPLFAGDAARAGCDWRPLGRGRQAVGGVTCDIAAADEGAGGTQIIAGHP